MASEALGSTPHVRWLAPVGRDGTWVAFAVWAALFATMLAAFGDLPHRDVPQKLESPPGV